MFDSDAIQITPIEKEEKLQIVIRNNLILWSDKRLTLLHAPVVAI